MRILFIGGTGIISTACVDLALARGYSVAMLNRGRRALPEGVEHIPADVNDPAATAAALGEGYWDAVVDFFTFTPAQVEQRLASFKGRTGQYIFISSASAYQKPAGFAPVTESTPLVNPFWQYSRDKAASEERFLQAHREAGFPITIVRPSHTYGETQVPLAYNSWAHSYTAVDRMRRGLPVVVPGDGLTLWTLTHNTDFAKALVGLLGRADAIGEAFHITSDEALTWNHAYEIVAEAAGAPPPRFVHIATDFLVACQPDLAGGLLGDKSNCALFDNTKIKRFVPEFHATTSFREGMKRTLAWFDADPARKVVDAAYHETWDKLVAAYERGLAAAKREFGR